MRYLLILGLALGLASAKGATISVEQGGWSAGGPLRVTFAGDDLDTDGAVSRSELTVFYARWQTPGGGNTRWLLDDIAPDGFLFTTVENYLLFAQNPQFSIVSAAFEGEVLSSVFDAFLFPVASSASPASPVPEPGSILLGATGCVLVLLGKRRR